MKNLLHIFKIIFLLCCIAKSTYGQPTFILTQEQDEVDFLSDVAFIDNNYYFIQNRLENIGPDFDSDAYSDVLITSDDGWILDLVNLNGYRSLYHRILKVESGEIFLLGSLKSDSCQSKLVISKFNIFNHTLEHLSFYNFCESIIQNIDYVTGLNGDTFIEGYSYVNGGFPKFILKIDSSYNLATLFLSAVSSAACKTQGLSINRIFFRSAFFSKLEISEMESFSQFLNIFSISGSAKTMDAASAFE